MWRRNAGADGRNERVHWAASARPRSSRVPHAQILLPEIALLLVDLPELVCRHTRSRFLCDILLLRSHVRQQRLAGFADDSGVVFIIGRVPDVALYGGGSAGGSGVTASNGQGHPVLLGS
jgi:hypothetical protein